MRLFVILSLLCFSDYAIAQRNDLLRKIANPNIKGKSYLKLAQNLIFGSYELYESVNDIKKSIDDLIERKFIEEDFENEQFVIVSPVRQVMFFFDQGDVHLYLVSTAARGLGERAGSLKTPRGIHRIKVKIGKNLPDNAILKGRVYTGDIWHKGTKRYEGKDLVLTRILWLEGGEQKNINSYSRYIYFHGSNGVESFGDAASHGCIRMGLDELVYFFDQVAEGTVVKVLSY